MEIKGFVYGNVYGGGQLGNVATGGTSITVSGTVWKDVYGGGFGQIANNDSFGRIPETTSVTISADRIVHGNVYGGGALGQIGTSNTPSSTLSTTITVNGTVEGNVYGGGKGVDNSAEVGKVYGRTSVTVNKNVNGNVYGGGAYGPVVGQVSIEFGDYAVIGTEGCDDNHGNVYGGGQGSDVNAGTGKVGSVAAMDVKGTVYGNVYGGGAYGNVAKNTADSNYNTNITVTGTVWKSVYGGGYGAAENTTSFGYIPGSTTIIVNGPVKGNVYGGGAYGQIGGSTSVTINADIGTSGCADNLGNVYGGGQGSENSPTIGRVAGNTSVTVNAGKTVWWNVYGGGAYGPVGGSTSVTINGDVLNVYGAGKGATGNSSVGSVLKVASVTVSGNVRGSVYGGGAFGSVLGEEGYEGYTVDIKTTAVIGIDVFGGGQGLSTNADFGKVNGNIELNLENGATLVGNVYGGGAYGQVKGDIAVLVSTDIGYDGCSEEVGNVYGGGQGVKTSTTVGLVTGSTSVTIDEGKTVYGNVYGGGAYGSVTGSTEVELNGTANEVYGAGKGTETNNEIGSVGNGSILTVTGTVLGNVYGGGAYGIVRNGTTVFINAATVGDSIFGGGLGKEGIVSVTGTVTLTVVNCHVPGNIYGGSAYGVVDGNVILSLSGGVLEGTVYGGGLGTPGHMSVSGTRRTYIHGDAVVNGSVYGGSSLGNDGVAGVLDSDSVVFLQSVILKGSVFGGGFMGTTYGSAKLCIGLGSISSDIHGREHLYSNIYDSNDESNRVVINESLYIGGDVGNVAASAAFRIAMVQNGGSLCICGTGSDISISGSIMGSGNSCFTLGQTSIHINDMSGSNALDMESVHRVTQLLIENSQVSLSGRATVNESGSPLIMNSMYALYKIGYQSHMINETTVGDDPISDSTPSFTPGLILRGGTTLTINASLDNVTRYASQNGDGQDTQPSSPFNKLILSGGNILILRSIDGSASHYSKVYGYTAFSLKGDDVGFGGYIFGSHQSEGGFMVSSGGVYVEADHYNILDGNQQVTCKCWFISGVINNTITVTTENNTTISSIVTLPSLHADTIYRYTGGIFIKSSPAQDYELVQQTSGLEDGDFYVRFGYLNPGDDTHAFVNFANGTFLKDSYSEDERSQPTIDGEPLILNPSMHIQIQGQFSSSQYVGYVIIYISEVRSIDLGNGGEPVYIVVNTIQTKINVYSSVSSVLSYENYETINIATVNKTGYTDLFLPTGHPGATVTVEEVTTELTRPSAVKLYIQSVKNGDNTLGWTDSLGSKQFYTDGQTTVTKVGTLQGGYISSLRFTVKDFNSTDGDEETYLVKLSITEGAHVYYYFITIHIKPEPNVLVVFNGIRTNVVNGEYNTVKLTYSFPYGSTLSKSDCPPGGENFVGWYTDEGYVNPFSYTTPLTKEVLNLYALYMCVVTFDYMDGTSSTYNINEHTPLGNNIPNPTRLGYDFIAYYTDKDYRIQWEMSNPVDHDMTLYAKWEGKTVNVRFFYYQESITREVEYDGHPLTYDIVFGDSFKVPFTEDMTMIQLAQDCMVNHYMKPGEKFIYWYATADGRTYAIYDDSYLKNYDLVETIDERLVVKLYARTSSIAIQVTMDPTVKAGSSSNSSSLDVKANVDPPASFLVFPESSEHSPYSFMVKLNGASRPGFELTGWELSKIIIGDTQYDVSVKIDGEDDLFKAGSTIAIVVTEEGGRYYVTFDGIDVMQGLTRFSMTEEGFKTPVEFLFVSEWEYIEYTITIAESTAGTITAYGEDLQPFIERTFHYNESINLRYDPVGGYVFYKWNTNGEGSFQDGANTETTYVVLGDATISALVDGPQFMEVIVDYISGADLTSEASKIPLLELLDKNTGEPITNYPFTAVATKVGGLYRVTYTGIADIGVYGTAIVGPTTGTLYDLGLDAYAETSVVIVDRKDPIIIVEDRMTAADGVVKTNGIQSLSEFILGTEPVSLVLNPGFTYTPIGSPEGIERNFTEDSRYHYSIAYPGSAVAVVGEIGKITTTIDISYSADIILPGSTAEVDYGGSYLDAVEGHVPDGYQVLFWYFGDDVSNRVTNMSMCDVDDGRHVAITGMLVRTGSAHKVDLTVVIQDAAYPVMYRDIYVLNNRVEYQFDLKEGYLFQTTVLTNLGERALACTEGGFLSLPYEVGMTEITVYQDKLAVSAVVTIDGVDYTSLVSLVEGSYVDLDDILDTYRREHSIEGRPYGAWVLEGFHGTIVDQRYTVVLDDILDGTPKRFSVESEKPQVTLISPAGTTILQWNGSAYANVGSMVKLDVPYPDVPGTRTAWYDGAAEVLHVYSLDGEKLFKVDLLEHATHYTIDDKGWSNLDASGELRTNENLTLISILNKNTYSVTVHADSNVSKLSVAYGEDSYEIVDGVVSGIPYNSSVRITVLFKDRYTINLDSLTAEEPGSKYIYNGVTSMLADKTTVEKRSSLQDYSIRFFLEGNTEIDLTSSYCGLTVYFLLYTDDGDEPIEFSYADPSMVIGAQFKKNVRDIYEKVGEMLLAEHIVLDENQYLKMWYKEPGLKTLWGATTEGDERFFVIDNMRSNQNFYAKIETLIIPDIDEIYSGNPYELDVSAIPSVVGNVSYTIRQDDGEYSTTIPSFTEVTSGPEYHDFFVKLDTYGIIQDIAVRGVSINIYPATVLVIPKNLMFSKEEVEAFGFNINNYHLYTIIGLNEGYSVRVDSFDYSEFEPALGHYNYKINFEIMHGASVDKRIEAPTILGFVTVTKTGYSSVTVRSVPGS
ncbi:MAG: InlB B-repeat-containing protein [archaeon]|nr:InlB B-repeat-containing protein [archaeon]